MPAATRRLQNVGTQLQTAGAAAEKSVSSPVLAKMNAVERYKYITGKEPLIQGLWPAFITPLTAAGEVDVSAIKPLCDYLIDVCGVHGLYACGGTGEMRSLTPEARKIMCAATCEAVAGRVPVVVCVGETVDTAAAVDLAEHAKSVGADGLSSTVPVWAVGDPDLLSLTVDLYTALGNVGLPLYAYWIAATKGDWGPQDYLDAMKDVPNFAGLKFTDYTFNTFQNLMSRSGYTLNVVSGPDEMMLAGKAMGAHGAIGTTYNVMPKMNVAINDLFLSGDIAGATDIMFKCNRVIEILTGQDADTSHNGTQTIAACKAVMRELQGLPAGYVHPKTSAELSDAEIKDLLAAIAGLGFIPE
jgi:dihydrodipicolinate synthase/N-acetylneuraminate lyase